MTTPSWVLHVFRPVFPQCCYLRVSKFFSWLLAAIFVLAAFVFTEGCGPCLQRVCGHPVRNRDIHGPANVEEYIAHLESPQRDTWQLPDAVVSSLGLKPSAWIADVGSGPGYFTRRLARAVPQGVVFAVDVEPRQLDRLNEHIQQEGLENVVPVLAPPDNPRLPPGLFDLVIVVDTYHHFPDRVQYLNKLRRALRPEGRLVIIDYHKRELPVGPPVEHKLEREVVLEEAAKAGFALVREFNFLPYQYFLVFSPETTRETGRSAMEVRS